MEVEIYRLVFAFIVGYFLTVSGSLTQLVTSNSLASPSTLGMDGFAVIFILIAQVLINFTDIEISLAYLSFALFLIFFIPLCLYKTKSRKNLWDLLHLKNIILLGLAFNLFIGALFSIIQFLFMAFNFEFPTGLWFGNFKQYSPNSLWGGGLIFVCVVFAIKHLAHKIHFLNLGSEFALGNNIDVIRLQRQSLLLSLFLTGVTISFFGVFSFFGLILPHIIRNIPLFSCDMKKELIWGPLLGGASLTLTDQACYFVNVQGVEFPVGMISSVLGALVLIFLLVQSKINRV